MDESSQNPLKVFLCHASGDKPAVRELYKRLIAEGWIEPWLDKEKLLPGQDFRVAIEKAVEDSDVIIACLSNASVNKEGFVQKELRYALDIALEKPEETIFLIPLRLEECNVPRRLRSLQWVDLFEEGGFAKLIQALKSRADEIEGIAKPDGDKQPRHVMEKVDVVPPIISRELASTSTHKQTEPRKSCSASIIVYLALALLVMGGLLSFGGPLKALFLPKTTVVSPSLTSTVALVVSPTPVEISISTSPASESTGKSPGGANPFYLSQYYAPKQRMGDIGDIQKVLGDRPDEFHFTYTTNGMGPQQWDFKCIDGQPNPDPARFAGIMLIDDNTGIGGTGSNNGYDLRGYKVIRWQARSINSDVKVLFVFGGVTWIWGDQTCVKMDAPYPDSFPSISFGPHNLTTDWQEFVFQIDRMPEEQLQHIVGVFGWTISWENNGVSTAYDENGKIIGAQNPKTLEIEIRNIRYEK